MKNLCKSLSALFILSIFLSGCVIQSRQLNDLLELIKDPSLDLSENSWLLHFSGYQSIVYAVSMPNGILFTNNFGDQVLFDGWIIREVRGTGRFQLNSNIIDSDNIRTLKRGNRAISNHHCDQWKKRMNRGVILYSQPCRGRQNYENTILVQNNGDISVIRQIVDESYTALSLTKLK